MRQRLWLAAAAVAIFLVIAVIHGAIRGPRGSAGDHFGLDFIAFYTGGSFVGEGRSGELFDLRAVQEFQRELARQNGVELGNALGPWWNPPFYAWVFVPLAKLPFIAATWVWIGFNLACAAISAWLLVRMLPKGCDWRSWMLVPVGMALFVPTIHAVTHGQNTCTSLLLLTLIVTAWRAERPATAGLIAGLLFYKPQLAAVLGAVLIVCMGWRALWGMAMTGSVLLWVTVRTMPLALYDFFTQMPKNLHFVQVENVYLWERHGTFKAFWRLLLQGPAAGEMSMAATLLAVLCMAGVAVALLRVTPVWRMVNPFASRGPGDESDEDMARSQRDRVIAAAIAATPLLMPFYFDYDLLLLAVPATLFAGDLMRRPGDDRVRGADRWLIGMWLALFGWMLINADFAETTRLNLAVPILAALGGLLIVRAIPRAAEAAAADVRHEPLARAA